MKRLTTLAIVASLGVLAACGNDDTSGVVADAPSTEQPDTGGAAPVGFATITPDDAATVLADAPDDLVVLDVRTPEEFAEGHLEGAVLVDFYDPGFADRLAELDQDVPYVVYCRSGNRSGQTLPLMQQLGFESAVDIGGGIVAWADAGLPVVVD